MDKKFRISIKNERYLPIKSIIGLTLMLCLFSCNKGVEEKFDELANGSAQPSGITVSYPLYGTIFPPEIPAPEFTWQDTLSGPAKYYVSFSTGKGERLLTQTVNALNWKPGSKDWETIKTTSNHEDVFFTVIGERKGTLNKKYTSGRASFSVSRDSVGAPVFFRAVPLPFGDALKKIDEIEWYLGHVNEKPRVVLDNVPVCANCHSFSKDGSHLAMDVDYANDKGSYVIAPLEDTIKLTFDKIITWSDYKREDGEKTFGLLSQISPDGKYVLSTVKDRSVFVPVDNLEYSQLFFPIKGIVAVYDREKGTYSELPGADDRSLVQSNPTWSPDGKEILFARASRYYSKSIENSQDVVIKREDAEEFISRKKDFKFNLYRVGFNEASGGEPMPVAGASGNNLSNYFARYSPDGKWIVFCQAENFMLLQPDSKLYIMPAEGGTPRLMNCNTNNMNSWHSWSPNGKWLVFSSKNVSPYTQLYLTHIDEHGNDSPPVLLENLMFSKKAVNIPEFVDVRKNNLDKIVDCFSQSASYFESLANNNMYNREFISALNNYGKAIETDSAYSDAYESRIMLNLRLRRSGTKEFNNDVEKAFQLINKQLRQKPDDPTILLRRANLEYYTDDNEAALKDALAAVELNPDYFDGYSLLALIYQRARDVRNTLECYRKLLELRPGNKLKTYHLGLYYKEIGNINEAYRIACQLIDKYPTEVSFYFLKADLLYMQGDKEGVNSTLDQAIVNYPSSYEGYLKRGLFREQTGQKELAKNDFEKAISLLTEGLEENPEDVEFLSFRAEILEQIGDLDGALADYEKYLTLIPLNYNVLREKAKIEYSRKQWLETRETHTVLIDNFPPQSDFFLNRCYANIRLGNRPEAVADLDKAQEFLHNDYYKLYDIAILKMNLNDRPGARKDLEKLASFLSGKREKGGLNNAELQLQHTVSEQLKQLVAQ